MGWLVVKRYSYKVGYKKVGSIPTRRIMRLSINTKRLVGMSEQEACQAIAAAGGQVNIVSRDCRPENTTTDFDLGRVNLEIRGGKVVKAHIG